MTRQQRIEHCRLGFPEWSDEQIVAMLDRHDAEDQAARDRLMECTPLERAVIGGVQASIAYHATNPEIGPGDDRPERRLLDFLDSALLDQSQVRFAKIRAWLSVK